MAFQLNLSSCQSGNCQHLILTDTSYDIVSATTWNAPPSPLMSNISTATLTISEASNTSVSYVLNVTGFFQWKYIGRVTGVLLGTTLTGTGTTFTTSVSVGDHINIANGSTYSTFPIASIISDTELTLVTPLTFNVNNEWAFDSSIIVHNPANLVFDIMPSDFGLSNTSSLNDDIYNIVYSVTDISTTPATIHTYSSSILLYCGVECCVYNKVQSIPQYYECNTCNSVHINDALTCWGLLMGLESAARCGSANALLDTLNLLKKLCHYKPCQGCK